MKKIISLFILLSLLSTSCSLFKEETTTTPPQVEKITEEQPTELSIKNDKEYITSLGDLLATYSDAVILNAVIFNVNPESISLDEWQSWVDENLDQWETIETQALDLLAYIEKENEAHLFKTAYAEEFYIENPYQNQFILSPNAGMNYEDEVQLIREEDTLEYQIIKEADKAPKGQQIKTLMEKFAFNDKKAAWEALQNARNNVTKKWNNVDEAEGELATAAAVIRDASFLTVAAGGVIISGGQIFTAATATEGVLAGLSTVFGGAELVLDIGEKAYTIADNREGAAMFKKAKDKVSPVNKVLGFSNLSSGLKDGGNLVTLYGAIDAVLKKADTLKIDLDEQLVKFYYDQENEEVTISSSGEAYAASQDPAYIMQNLENVLKKDADVKIDGEYINTYNPNYQPPVISIPREELNPAPPITEPTPSIDPEIEEIIETIEEETTLIPIMKYSSDFEVTLAGVPAGGHLEFTLNPELPTTGTLEAATNLTIQGYTATSFTTATLTVTYNKDTKEVLLTGPYTSTMDQVSADSGVVTANGILNPDGTISGSVTFSSITGVSASGSWSTY